MGSRALIVLDAKDSLMHAFNYYFEHVHKSDNEIIVVHALSQGKSPVVPCIPAFMPGLRPEGVERMSRKPKRVNAYESEYTQKMIDHKAKYKVRLLEQGLSGKAICQIAHEENAHYIILIDDRPRTGLKRVVAAPVAEYVVKNASMPVTVVPAPPLQMYQLSYDSYGMM